MLGQRFAFSEAPLKRIREVQFGVMSPEEIASIKDNKNGDSAQTLTFFLHRKRTRSQKLSTQKSWMNLVNERKWAV